MRHIHTSILAMLFCALLTVSAFAQETATPASTALGRSPQYAVKSKESFDSLLQSAEAGNVVAMMDVATAYNYGLYKDKNGFDLGQDTGQALAWSRKAAAQGYAPAQNNLGDFYWRGWGGVQKDDSQAIRWYRKAAEQGYAPAQNNLGYFYQNGWGGVQKDASQAMAWYQKAAAQGYEIANHNLAAAPALDIVARLEQAKNEKIQLSREEKSKLKNYSKDSLNHLEHCNQNDYYNTHSLQDTSRSCSEAAGALKQAIGVSSRATELAYLRSCSFRGRFGGVYDTCPDLGGLYEERGDYAMAMAVYLHAPNCEQPQPYTSYRESCLIYADRMSEKLGDKPLEARITKDLCQRFSDANYCFNLDRYFGGSVDVEAVAQKSRAMNEREGRALDAEEAAELQERSERRQEREDKWNAVTSALQSMPGENDPNAILNAANQQSAQMMAVGAANDAARQQAALQQQAQTAQRAQARVATQQQSVATSSNSPASSPTSGAETPAEQQPVQAISQPETVPQLPPGCLRVSVKLFYDNQPDSGMYYGVNNCGVPIHVDIAMASGYTGATSLPLGSSGFLGASANMGAYKVWYCPVPYWPSDPNNHPENGPTYSADLNSVVCRDPSNPGQRHGNAVGSTQ